MQKKRLFSLQRSQNTRTVWRSFLVFFVIFGLFTLVAVPVIATGDLANQTFTGTGLGTNSLAVILLELVRIFFAILGVIAVLLLIYAGFIWMTSAGDPEKVIKAKQIILNAVIGLIIIFSAFAIATFVISVLRGVTGGGGGGITDRIPGGIGDWSRSAIGAGPIQSVYPAPNQTNVPINTRIAVTFKNDIVASTICEGATADNLCNNTRITENISICELATDSPDCKADSEFTEADFADTTVQSVDAKTFVFATSKNLGNEDNAVRTFRVSLKEGIKRKSDNKSVFVDMRVAYYNWAFKTNGKLDLTPPEIAKFEIYPFPDRLGDEFRETSSASAGTSSISLAPSLKLEKPYRIQGTPYVGQPLTNVRLATTTATNVNLFFNSDNTFATYNTDDKTYAFSVNSAGTQIQFAGNTTIGTDLGIASSVLTACGANKCLNIVNGNRINTGAGFYLLADGELERNSGYSLTITAPQTGDTLVLDNGGTKTNFVFYDNPTREVITRSTTSAGTVVSTNYFTINASANSAVNLANRLNEKVGSLLTATVDDANVSIVAKSAGANNLSLSGTGAVNVTGNLSGTSRISNWIVNGGVKDAYNNSVFRITFTKAINPLDIDKYIKIKIDGVERLAQDIASTTVTNQYRTVELTARNQCGVNACGQPIFCWLPEVASGSVTKPVEIEVMAASLKPCTASNNAWCTAFGGTCETSATSRCRVPATGLFHPQAKDIPDGLADLSNNSFNGNFNKASTSKNVLVGNAEGPSGLIAVGRSGFVSPFDLNATIGQTSNKPLYTPSNTTGDNFKWSFWLSNQIDLTAPMIGSLEPVGDAQVLDFVEPVKIYFSTNTLIRTSTIKPGWGYGTSTADGNWFTRFLVLKTLTTNANPVGYWTSSNDIDVDGDGLADYTRAVINHNPFDQSVNYGPLAGSGIESITQNCFLPGAGPINAGAQDQVCVYQNGETSGCVTDTTLGDAQVKPTNPSSYSTLNCNQVEGASICPGQCKDFTGLKEGSWIITKDKSTADASGKTGCCFGRCSD